MINPTQVRLVGPAAAASWTVVAALIALLARAPVAIADENQPANGLDEAKVRFFESRVRPVLIEHCYECHSAGAKSLEGELKLDTRAGWQAGGVSGPSVVPGDPKASLLAKAIRFDSKDLQMPPAGKLPDEVIADVEKWIADGAVDPRDGVAKTEEKSEKNRREANQRWAFTKPVDPPLPQVANSAWPANDVDRFLLAKLEGAGLVPVDDADKRTWIRRATFDLIGLPPSPEEVEAFASDDSPQAYAKVVDRLLESRQYGERWGRYWLDVVRYADTAGDNSDFPIPQMYKYRNWVIDAFNRDMPYDEFVRQQLAGDLLPSANVDEHRQKLLATGYLANARRFGSRVDDYPMHLTIEDTIDNLGRAFLGLSLNCARCHDHKFDPVSTEDYYALYGFFASTRYPWPGIELEQRQRDLVPLVNDDVVARAKQEREARQKELDEEVKRLEKLRDAAKDDARKELDKQVGAARAKAEQHGKQSPPYELAYAVADMPSRGNAKVQYKGDPNKTGPEVPRRFVIALGGQALPADDTSSGRLHLARMIASADNPLTARVMVNRIWQHHFGRGLVPTSNDFGKQGRGATHPELLDWLAHRFVESGWSIKFMHRLMMLSRAYRLAALDDAERLAKDPSNDLLSGFRRKRLDAEAIRDTLLLLGGTLDPSPGEAHPFPPQQEWGFTQHNPFKAVYPTNRRSVYIMTQRIQRDPYLAIFDGADPSASTAVRTSTTTTLQSLYLLNNPLVHEQAAKIAERLRNDSPDNGQRVNLAYERLFARQPSEEERSAGLEFVSQGDSKQAWESYVRALLRLNEFVYID